MNVVWLFVNSGEIQNSLTRKFLIDERFDVKFKEKNITRKMDCVRIFKLTKNQNLLKNIQNMFHDISNATNSLFVSFFISIICCALLCLGIVVIKVFVLFKAF